MSVEEHKPIILKINLVMNGSDTKDVTKRTEGLQNIVKPWQKRNSQTYGGGRGCGSSRYDSVTFSQRFMEQDREVSILVTDNASNHLKEATNPGCCSAEELPNHTSPIRISNRNTRDATTIQSNRVINRLDFFDSADVENV